MRLTVFLFLLPLKLLSQSVISDFQVSPNACLNESIKIQNQSINATSYEWDFCQGDLTEVSKGSLVTTVAGNVIVGIDLVFDGFNWFGFVTSRETNSIKRLDFGSDLNSVPSIIDLGNIGGISPWRPIDIQIIYDEGEWFGFVYGESSNLITRIDFGSSLTNTSGLLATVIVTGSGNGNCGLDVVAEGDKWIIGYTNTYGFGTIVLNTIRSTPIESEKMHTGNLEGILNVGDIKLINDNTNWYAYLPIYGSQKLFRAKFGIDPLSSPALTDISNNYIGSLSPYGIDIGFDKGSYFAFLSTIEGALLRIDLSNDLDASPVAGSNLGNLGVLGNTLKIDLVKQQSRWTAMSLSWNDGRLFRINFSDPNCEMLRTSADLEPALSYPTAGLKYVTLRAFKGPLYSEKHENILVNSLNSPIIDFENDNICLQSELNFTLQSDQSISSQEFSFGDTQTSTDPNPSHQYSAPGDYLVSLQVTADNGCNNYTEKTISIYDQPIADFNLPTASPLCSNQNYLFENTSITDPGYPVTWQWTVNGDVKSSSEDLAYAFPDVTNQDIMLTASIPGCSTTVTKSITSLNEGPVVDFSFEGQCEDDDVVFTNNSSGNISSYSWNFDDGQNSGMTDPTHVFTDIGSYDVSLTASSPTGCNNSIIKNVMIYSKPNVNFGIEAPPFSCSGTNSYFINNTPNPVDGNITSWLWDFGDPSSGSNTSVQKTPQHIYSTAADYTVSLTATTNFGCSSLIQKSITVSETPVAGFSTTPTCQDVDIVFTDQSQNAQQWNWQIGNSFFSQQNPTHRFVNAGSYTASLTVTSSNGCIATLSKPIIVPAKLTPNFNVTKNCVNEQTLFTDITNDAADPVVERKWNINGTSITTPSSSTTYTFQTASNYTPSLSLTTSTGCVTNAVSKIISVGLKPVASFVASPETGGAPLVVQFSNTSTGAVSYSWRFNDPSNAISSQVNPKFTFQNVADYNVELTAFNLQQCSSTVSKLIRAVQPFLNIGLSKLDLIETAFGGIKPEITITNNSNVPVSNVALRIDLSGKSSLRETTSGVISPGGDLIYRVPYEITDPSLLNFVCVEVDANNDIDFTNNRICESVEGFSYFIPPFPNPADDHLNIEWLTRDGAQSTVSFTNSVGSVVWSSTLTSGNGFSQVSVDIKNLPDGVYLVSVVSEGLRKSYRVIISH